MSVNEESPLRYSRGCFDFLMISKPWLSDSSTSENTTGRRVDGVEDAVVVVHRERTLCLWELVPKSSVDTNANRLQVKAAEHPHRHHHLPYPFTEVVNHGLRSRFSSTALDGAHHWPS